MMKRAFNSSGRGAGALSWAFPVSMAALMAAGFAAGPLLLSQSELLAQTDAEEEATESIGTITEFSPDTIVIRTERSAEPIPFSYSKTTTYVDENGAPVARETIRKGSPVTVYYTREGGHMVATRVVVRKSAPSSEVIERKTTTTTTTEDEDR